MWQDPAKLKQCPRCAERVQPEAVICRGCSYGFTAGDDNRAYNRQVQAILVRIVAGVIVVGLVVAWLQNQGGAEALANFFAGH
jgi:hypothetical protein